MDIDEPPPLLCLWMTLKVHIATPISQHKLPLPQSYEKGSLLVCCEIGVPRITNGMKDFPKSVHIFYECPLTLVGPVYSDPFIDFFFERSMI